MLILLHGPDTYRSRQKLIEIISRYKEIHQSGLNLIWFREEQNFEKIKEAIEAVSMFKEKKLIILADISQNKDFQEQFLQYAKKSKLKENKDVIIVVYEKYKIQDTKYKILTNMSQEFNFLEAVQLTGWIEKEVKKQEGQIDKAAAQKLAFYLGHDLWQVKNEITKLIHYQPRITSETIDLLIKPQIEANIFQTIDALGGKNKKTALKFLYKHLERGENENYLLTMLVYQFRNLIKLKGLTEQNVPYYDLAKRARLHPFVVKKTSAQLRNFGLSELKDIYRKLLETEIGIKKGRFDAKTALDLLAAEL